jgi:hypothetical protein
MKSKDQSGSEDISADERKLPTVTTSLNIVCKIRCFIFSMFQQSLLVQFTHQKLVNQEYSSQKMEIFIQSVPKIFWQTSPNGILEKKILIWFSEFNAIFINQNQFLLDLGLSLVVFGADWIFDCMKCIQINEGVFM